MRTLAAALLLGASLMLTGCSTIPSRSANDIQAVEASIDNYRRSVETLDFGLAENVWLTTGEATFIHPRGHSRGWPMIRKQFYEETMGALFSSRKLVLHDVHVMLHHDSAYVEFYWNFEAKMRSDGSMLHTAGRESQEYVRGPNGWRLAHVHYSTMPVTGERQGL